MKGLQAPVGRGRGHRGDEAAVSRGRHGRRRHRGQGATVGRGRRHRRKSVRRRERSSVGWGRGHRGRAAVFGRRGHGRGHGRGHRGDDHVLPCVRGGRHRRDDIRRGAVRRSGHGRRCGVAAAREADRQRERGGSNERGRRGKGSEWWREGRIVGRHAPIAGVAHASEDSSNRCGG